MVKLGNMIYSNEQIQAIKNGAFSLSPETVQLLVFIEKNLDIPIQTSQPTNDYCSNDRPHHHKYGSGGGGGGNMKSSKPALVKSSRFAALDDESSAHPPVVFKVTKFAVKTGITKQINEIRMKINNLSTSTYTKNSSAIIELITQWKSESEEWESDLKQVCEAIFDIVSKTKLNSELNADLYKLCISNFDEGNGIFTETIHNGIRMLETMIDSVEYSDPNLDYDKYCVYSKQIAQIIGMSTFYVNSAKNMMVSVDKIYGLLETLLGKIDQFIHETDKVATVELLADVIFVIVEAFYPAMSFDKPELLKRIVDIAGYKNKQYPSVSNRFVFKFMDMRDLIAKV